MIRSILTMAFAMVALVGGAAHAKSVCKRAAVQVAQTDAPGYKRVFDIQSFDETPDLITFEVTLADVVPDPKVTQTVEVTLAKATCSLVSDPIKK